ncbi:Periodic tryptophan protein 1 [Wickerhamomyces ciferrii]|uniref:Periodic tryptophan protein 1 n=1 Tax=Wickerhamomyces ciferrii (strain ATCC 14091 / BCRC 22168 / CBS 111 / JCM 3599 / NBRC 0793 / NRRL Y-1031 F-60-10) TaxID=1206466 RepID=K0K8Z7_WICCF|nr:Periodic tryptophan protein 1 [Wickerhamomyces ciferrii]CCH41330.1 Periodic tryptophan protein 1 [Wickerhamomyces ciferrii]
MLSSSTWVPRGFAKEFPDKYELDDEEMERINQLAQLEINDAKEEIEELQNNGNASSDSPEEEEDDKPKTAKLGDQFEIDDDLKEYDLEHYDDDDEETQGSRVTMLPGLSNDAEFHEDEDGDEAYITLPNEEETVQDKQESQIYPTDNLILSTRTEDDVSFLDIHIYDDGADDLLDPEVPEGHERPNALYVHHDLMLPAFPLAVEWINFKPNQPEGESDIGNFAAVGTFDPQIEIWNLDCMDKAFPDIILGEPSGAPSLKKKSKKTKKNKHITTHHIDAVLSLSHNRSYRNILASTSADTTVKLWDLNTATAARSFNQIHSGKNVSSSQWHSTEQAILLTGGYDSRVALTDVRIQDDSKTSKYWSINGDVENVKWVNESQFLAGNDQGGVYCFDIRTLDKPIWTLQAHDAGISSLDVNQYVPEMLATSAMGEKTVKLWKIPTYTEGEVLKNGPSMVMSRDFGVGNVLTTSFAPDIEVAGNIVIGGVNKGLKMFDFFSNKAVRSNFKNELSKLQKQAREEAKEKGKQSRIARKYDGNYTETMIQVDDVDGDVESEDEGGDDDIDIA